MERAPISLVLVIAVADNGVIGRAGGLPWRLKSDLQHFRALTLGHPLIMGRKTYASVGRPLPGRTNIVVTRDPDFAAAGVAVAASLQTALTIARGDALRRGVAAIMVIGGADLYAQTLPLAERLEITHVHAAPEGDTVLAPLDPAVWHSVARREAAAAAGDDAAMTFVTYERRD